MHAGFVGFHLLVADVDAVGDDHQVFDDALDAFKFKVVIEPLVNFFLTEVPVEVRFFPLSQTGEPTFHVLLARKSDPSIVPEIDVTVMASAEVSVELNVWVRVVKLVRVMFTGAVMV